MGELWLAVPAGVEIDGDVAVLGPGVDAEMGLLEHHDTGDTLGSERVEDRGHDGTSGLHRRLTQGFAAKINIVEQRTFAAAIFREEMSSEWFQFRF